MSAIRDRRIVTPNSRFWSEGADYLPLVADVGPWADATRKKK